MTPEIGDKNSISVIINYQIFHDSTQDDGQNVEQVLQIFYGSVEGGGRGGGIIKPTSISTK